MANEKTFANPAPLGLVAFALSTWLLSLINAGFYTGDSTNLVLGMGFVFGGTTQFIAGLLQYPRGETFSFTAFCTYGAFWLTWAVITFFFKDLAPAHFMGWFLSCWGAFTVIMFFGSLRENRVLQLIFLTVSGVLFGLAIGSFTGDPVWNHFGGWCGLVAAAAALYLSAAELLNTGREVPVLPVGSMKK